MHRRPPTLSSLALLAALTACGARTGTIDERIDASTPTPEPERCNRLDDDLDGEVDEDFRPPDADGLYVDDAHCGACDRPCGPAAAPAVGDTTCRRIEGVPTCAATGCQDGFALSATGRCVPSPGRLCSPCLDDGDCGDLAGAICADVGGAPRCTQVCESTADCPDGTRCGEGLCVPPSGGCDCGPGDDYVVACALEDPDGGTCVGTARCAGGRLSACVGFAEACNGADDDCDGEIDEDFVDRRGAYSVDPRHCGACGVSCLASTVPEGDLVCGGDPFAPSCVLDCPDARDGVDPGDRVDGDRDVSTGCECTVSDLRDAPGPVDATGEALDVDCDGADGEIAASLYVAPDGDDGNPGSPTRPLRTLAEAVARAADSLAGDAPRPDVFVAGGLYGETLRLPDGVRVHGGYRRDFLALDPDGFRTEIRAPAGTVAPGGAALLAEGAGETSTVLEWVFLVGLDAEQAGAPTFGAILVDPGPRLVLRESEIRTGLPRGGRAGADGRRGADPTRAAGAGAAPRGAVEDDADRCEAADPANTVGGGAGGASTCGGADVGGGRGGSASCPGGLFPPSEQGPGDDGRGAGAGEGGDGGLDVVGPISGPSCPAAVCCGLADFTVPSGFAGPEAGTPGGDGRPGDPGAACDDPFGRFEGGAWLADVAAAGGAGRPGAGGGGGGAGGGARIDAVEGVCEFVDGLGGGGGGGGAGGCGGAAGAPGTSGGVAVALLVRAESGPLGRLPTLRDLVLRPAAGGRGGDGGAGGEGGRGGAGAPGGTVPRTERTTPTLAGPAAGAPGGDGGDGGDGGGGGGGCGGASVGIWVTGDDTVGGRVEPWRDDNDIVPGAGGDGGRGGSGAPDGADGPGSDLLVR